MADIEINRTIHLDIFKYENNEFNYIYSDLTEGIVADSLRISEIMIDGEFKFGQVNSNMFEVELINISDISNCYIYAYASEVKQVNSVPVTTSTDLFTGIIDECKYDKHSGSYKITAYDFTYKYGDYDVSALIQRACDFYIENYSTSFKLNDFISYTLSLIIGDFKYPYYFLDKFDLNNDIDINIATLYKINDYVKKHSITFKDLLRQIGEFALGFVNVDRSGKLEILQTTRQHSESEYLFEEDCELNNTEIYPKNNLFPGTVNIYSVDGTILDTYTSTDEDISFDDKYKFYGSYNITENILFDSVYNTLSGIYALNFAELLFYVILSTLQNINASIPLIISRLDTKIGDSFGLFDVEYETGVIPNFMVYKNELSGNLLINQTISSELSAFSSSNIDETTSTSQEVESNKNSIDGINSQIDDINSKIDGINSQIKQIDGINSQIESISSTLSNRMYVHAESYNNNDYTTHTKQFSDWEMKIGVNLIFISWRRGSSIYVVNRRSSSNCDIYLICTSQNVQSTANTPYNDGIPTLTLDSYSNSKLTFTIDTQKSTSGNVSWVVYVLHTAKP